MNNKAVSGILSVALILTMFSSSVYAQSENDENDAMLSEGHIWYFSVSSQEEADDEASEESQNNTEATADKSIDASIAGNVASVLESSIQQAAETENNKKEIELTEELKLMIATVYGEAASCSESSWEAIANVIMNRIGYMEWKKCTSASDVIRYSRFDAYTYRNKPYRKAMEYLNNTNKDKSRDPNMEKLIEVVAGVYNKENADITGGAVLYYSPKAQKLLNKKKPGKYAIKPKWNFKKLEEAYIQGTGNDDLKFYKYKNS